MSKSLISKFIVFPVLALLTLTISVTAQAREEAVYVGEGRYVGEDRDSSDTAVLRQRNQEQTIRQQERNRDEERYERAERRERSYERESSDYRY